MHRACHGDEQTLTQGGGEADLEISEGKRMRGVETGESEFGRERRVRIITHAVTSNVVTWIAPLFESFQDLKKDDE